MISRSSCFVLLVSTLLARSALSQELPVVVDLDARVHGPSDPVTLSLPAGSFTVTPIRGAFTAFNPWGSTLCGDSEGCAVFGWSTAYLVVARGQRLVPGAPPGQRVYPTAAQALARATPSSFTLFERQDVGFAVDDQSSLGDNLGGLSLLVSETPSPEDAFVRGDSNTDGQVDVSDSFHIALHLFADGIEARCEKASDANGDGVIDVSDIIFLLHFLFRLGPAPPAPFPACGLDVATDSLSCADYPLCELTLSDLRVTGITARSAVVRWTTSLPADSRVDFGTDPALGMSVAGEDEVEEHVVTLEDLTADTEYRVRATSTFSGGPTVGGELSFRTREGIAVTNLTEGESLRYELALLVGTTDTSVSGIDVTLRGDSRRWPVSARRFKALVPLAVGENRILLETGDARREFALTYRPSTNPRFVRLIYMLAADGDGSFDAPAGEPNDVASAVERLQLAGLLMQTVTAEKLHARGLARRTFRLLRGADGQPEVLLFRSSLTMATSHAMTGNDLWSHFWMELDSLPQRGISKDLVIMSMTRYHPPTGTALAHTALGGDRLALFGSAGLHTWAPSLDELVARFSDTRRIDARRLLDDSNSRATYWANYATGLGASLHELGHTFTLPHTPTGFMSRDFDFMNRVVMIREPASARTSAIAPILPGHEPDWHPDNARILATFPWLDSDA